jgi:hypothetical protein
MHRERERVWDFAFQESIQREEEDIFHKRRRLQKKSTLQFKVIFAESY